MSPGIEGYDEDRMTVHFRSRLVNLSVLIANTELVINQYRLIVMGHRKRCARTDRAQPSALAFLLFSRYSFLVYVWLCCAQ